MNNLEDIKTMVELLPIDQSIKDKVISSSDEIIKFQKFISEKYTVTHQEAISKIQSELENMYSQSAQNGSPIEMLETHSENAQKFAESEGYEKAEQLKTAIIDLSNAIKSFHSK